MSKRNAKIIQLPRTGKKSKEAPKPDQVFSENRIGKFSVRYELLKFDCQESIRTVMKDIFITSCFFDTTVMVFYYTGFSKNFEPSPQGAPIPQYDFIKTDPEKEERKVIRVN